MHSIHSSSTVFLDEQRLTRIQSRISELESDLRDLECQYRALALEGKKLLANITAKRVRHAPIRDLLPEICDIIFAYCAESECSLDCNTTSDFNKLYPLVLAGVCHRWREMVMNNPTLWTTLHLRPNTCNSHEVDRLDLFLVRSADLPLNITICPATLIHMDWDTRSISATVLPILRRLLPQIHRIKSLKSHLGMEILPVLFPTGTMVDMPLMENLNLFIDDHHVATPTLGLLNSPKLRNLHVRDITPLVDALAETMPLLQTLTITECETLEVITFPSNVFFMDLAPIVLPELEYLNLQWPFLFEPSPIFCALRAPNLRYLRISHLSRQLIMPPRTLSSLTSLLHSASQLKHLVISGCNLLAQDESIVLLQECRSIQKLEIVNCQRGDRFLVPLTPSNPADASTWMCPLLTHVTISGLQDSDVRPVITFAKSRSKGQQTTSTNGIGSPEGTHFKFLSELVLDTHSPTLSRQGRLLILSGLFGMQRFLNIVGSYGNLFGSS